MVTHLKSIITKKGIPRNFLRSTFIYIKRAGRERRITYIIIKKSTSYKLALTREGSHSDIIRDLKKFTSKKIIDAIQNNPEESRKEWMMDIFRNAGKKNSNNKDFQFWQQDNHPIELFSPLFTFQKINYVHNNPVSAGIVEEVEHYLHSSARDYIDIKGILHVDILERPGSLEGYVFNG